MTRTIEEILQLKNIFFLWNRQLLFRYLVVAQAILISHRQYGSCYHLTSEKYIQIYSFDSILSRKQKDSRKYSNFYLQINSITFTGTETINGRNTRKFFWSCSFQTPMNLLGDTDIKTDNITKKIQGIINEFINFTSPFSNSFCSRKYFISEKYRWISYYVIDLEKLFTEDE